MPPKRVIVTGVSGMDGSHMVDYLLKNTDMDIYGMVRRSAKPDYSNIKHVLNNPRFKLVTGDLSDSQSIDNLVRDIEPDYFINFAAQSFVGSSWQIPEQTFDSGAMGVLRCLEAIRKHTPFCRFYNAGCHDIETKVLTKQGIKEYTSIRKGDLVCTINPKTKDLEWKPVIKVLEYDYEGNLFEFKNGGLRVTPNHRMFYKTNRGNILVKEASEFIKLSDVKYPRNNPLSGKLLPDSIDLSEFIPVSSKKGNDVYGKHISSINSKDLMYLIGLYIGDGSSRILKKKNKVHAVFSQRKRLENGQFADDNGEEKLLDVEYSCPQCIIDIPPEDEAYPRLIETLERNGITWSLHGQCDVTIHQWGLMPYFSECGNSASTKRIPEWIFDLDASYQKLVLEGIIDSDGDGRGCISTCSKRLQNDLIRLHLNCGIIPSIRERAPRTAVLKDGRLIKGNLPEYNITGLKENTGYQRGNYDVIPYKGKVWCLEVQDNHNFVVERKGKITFSGNSSEEFGDTITVPQNESHPLRPQSPYGAAKCAARHLVRVYRESYGLYAIQGILFNHEGKRRGEEFVTRKITKTLAKTRLAIDIGMDFPALELGNLEAKRDWSDAEDFVDGVWRMLNQDAYNEKLRGMTPQYLPKHIKEYVLSSNETHTVREFVELALINYDISGNWVKGATPEDETFEDNDGTVIVKINPKFYRPAEVNLLHGNSNLARKELGWAPKVGFEKLVEKMCENDLNIEILK